MHSVWHKKLPLTAILQALNGLTSTVLVKIAQRISPGIGTHASGETEMANKHIRYGNYVAHIVYPTLKAHGHTLTQTHNHIVLKLKCSRGIESECGQG